MILAIGLTFYTMLKSRRLSDFLETLADEQQSSASKLAALANVWKKEAGSGKIRIPDMRQSLSLATRVSHLRQHTPHPTRAGFLIGDRLAAEEADLPGHDVVGRMWRSRPIDFRLDVGEGMSGRQGRVMLRQDRSRS